MEQIAIVKKRSKILPTIITLLILALIVLAVFYFIGDVPATTA